MQRRYHRWAAFAMPREIDKLNTLAGNSGNTITNCYSSELLMVSKSALSILIFCFYVNILALVSCILYPFVFILIPPIDSNMEMIQRSQGTLFLPALILWFYCIYFYYKFDKYSKAGLKLFFLWCIYSPYYFYTVIWKRKRPLENTSKNDPVLGNTIHIETEEEDTK